MKNLIIEPLNIIRKHLSSETLGEILKYLKNQKSKRSYERHSDDAHAQSANRQLVRRRLRECVHQTTSTKITFENKQFLENLFRNVHKEVEFRSSHVRVLIHHTSGVPRIHYALLMPSY